MSNEDYEVLTCRPLELNNETCTLNYEKAYWPNKKRLQSGLLKNSRGFLILNEVMYVIGLCAKCRARSRVLLQDAYSTAEVRGSIQILALRDFVRLVQH